MTQLNSVLRLLCLRLSGEAPIGFLGSSAHVLAWVGDWGQCVGRTYLLETAIPPEQDGIREWPFTERKAVHH